MMKRLSVRAFALSALVVPLCAWAEIEWLQREIDFGTFLEANGPKTASVRFVNRGPGATVISRVRPSCGCTGETHTEDVIAPGDTATISVTYNPIGRPGRFEKTVKVYTGEHDELTTIPIHGTVIGTSETLMRDYPVVGGALRLSDARLVAGEIKYGSARHFFVSAYNQSNDTIHPVFSAESPALSIDASRQAIPPGDVGSFSIYFNSRELREPGPVELPIVFRAGKGVTDEATVIFTANVVPDIGSLTPEQAADGPRLYAKPDLVDLGLVKGTKKITREFAIFNQGKSELAIHRIACSVDGVRVPKYPVRLAPGKSGKATVEIDAAKLASGPASIHLDIYSNDPIHPVTTVRVAVEKEAP